VPLWVWEPNHWLAAAVFVKVVTERNAFMLFVGELHSPDDTAVRCIIAQCSVCYCECGSPSVPVTAVSWMLSVSVRTLHVALYRSIYILQTWSCLGALQGILVCYCECGSPSVPLTAVSWMLLVSTQALHATRYRFIYSLLTWSCLGTLQGFLVCYCEWGSPSVRVTAVS